MPRAVPAPTSLAVVGVSSFNSSATAAAYSASLNPPANAVGAAAPCDGALVLFVTRSNGAGPAYAPALTWAGLPAALLSENSAGVGDFGVIAGAFLARGGFVLGDAVGFSLGMGASAWAPRQGPWAWTCYGSPGRARRPPRVW